MQLAVADLACRRAGRTVFAGLSFRVGPGETLAVTGRNGAGKSTLLFALAGLLVPSRGTITLGEHDAGARPERVHHLAHRDGLKPSLSAAENLRFARACLGSPALAAEAALAEVGLARAADLPAAYLSAGQRRRLALARLLVSRRPIWLLDEPTTALDTDGQAMLAGLMAAHLAGGGLIVAATHAVLPVGTPRELSLDGTPAEARSRSADVGGNPLPVGGEAESRSDR